MSFFELKNFWALVLEIQLFLFAGALLFYTKRQNKFWVRFAICAVIAFAAAYFYPGFAVQDSVLRAITQTLKYVFLATPVFFSSKICFKIGWTTALFIATSSYAIQHLSSEIEGLISKSIIAIFHIEGDTFWLSLILTIIFPLALATGVYLYARRKKNSGEFLVRSLPVLLMMLAVIIVDITLSGMRSRALREVNNPTLEWLTSILSLMAAALIVGLLFNLIRAGDLKQEVATIDAILHKEREQWATSKELVETVNIKYHDLKHRLRAIRKSGTIDLALLKEIEKDISLYDSTIHTGNEAVDVILNERLAYCKSENILLSAMIDGSCLDFVDLADLYALLGNAISNAIEAVIGIENREKRIINLLIKEQRGFASIHMENYFREIKKGKDGALLTTKEDAHNHGYGVKSMIRIVEKYGGTISLTQEGDVFLTDILLPRPS